MNHTAEIKEDFMKRDIVRKYFPVAVVFFMVYVLVSFFISKDYLQGWILLGTLIYASLAMLIFTKTKNLSLVGNMFASLGLPTLLPWLINGGPGGIGFWWSIVYVIWAFFVTEKKAALAWLSIHLVFSVIIVVLSLKGFLKIAYQVNELINMGFAYVVTVVLVYLFNRVREYYFELSLAQAKRLSEVNVVLDTANKELKHFVYISTHHLQEPLRTIANFAELITEKYEGKQDKETEEYLRFISVATSKMQTLIKDLMNFSRIEKGGVVEAVDCNEVMKTILADLEPEIRASRAKITVSSLPIIEGNYENFKQLFRNLLDNALKFCKEKVPPVIEVKAIERQHDHLFIFKDNGMGIEHKNIKKLFNMFERLNASERYSGTGIGLAAAQKIVGLYKGNIWVESKFQEGSTFYFTIHK